MSNIVKFEVKNVKTFDTSDGYAFSLTVYGDGKKLGVARNGGYGGPNEYEPRSLEKLLNDHAKTLPPITIFKEPMDHNDETFVEELMMEAAVVKDYKASLRKSVLFVKKATPGVFTLKFDKNGKETMEAFIIRVKNSHMEKFDIKLILNGMDFDESLKIYKDAMDEAQKLKNAKTKAMNEAALIKPSAEMSF